MKRAILIIATGLASLPASAQVVTRGPYLQLGTPTSIVVRWRTDQATDSVVRFGDAPGALAGRAADAATTSEHVVLLTDLAPATRYHYAVGSSAGSIAGDDLDHHFTTPPLATTAVPFRAWVIGDAGTADANQAAVRDAYSQAHARRATDLWLMLGDNAYLDGTDADYQAAVFDVYPELLRTAVSWSTFGNHDARSASSAGESGPYYDIFTLPRVAEAGGVPSGTEAYYSFDRANVHFICLDSQGSSRSPSGAMLTWLQQDLAATSQDWIVAFWHHPPYSKGSHDSDSDTELRQMRQNALPILEAGGVDLVLSGHSHSYERSALLDGHYGNSGSFLPSMWLDPGDGRESGSGAYRKPPGGPAARAGAVYAVAGSSGRMDDTGTLDHPAMQVSLALLGSLVLEVSGGRMDLTFLGADGVVQDAFTIRKGSLVPPRAPLPLLGQAAGDDRIDLWWADRSDDETGFLLERSADGIHFVPVATLAADATAHTDRDVLPSTVYVYRLHAFNLAGSSLWSNEVTVETCATMSTVGNSLQLVRFRAGALVTWSDVAAASSYNLYSAPEKTAPFDTRVLSRSTGAPPGALLPATTGFTLYAVKATDGCDEGDAAR